MKKLLDKIVKENRITWQRHAFQRMLERNISRKNVQRVLIQGEITDEYPNDHPFPSNLILGFMEKNAPLHVVAAVDK